MSRLQYAPLLSIPAVLVLLAVIFSGGVGSPGTITAQDAPAVTPAFAESDIDILCKFELGTRAPEALKSPYIPSLGITGGHLSPRGYVAVQGHDGIWHVSRGWDGGNSSGWLVWCEAADHARLAYPVDPRMQRVDIEGARYTYLNDAGDAWLFSHTKPAAHHDHELAVLGALAGIFQPLLAQYQVDAFQGTGAAQTRAQTLYVTVAGFYGDVIVEAKRIVRAAHHGARHQDPDPAAGHVTAELAAAVAAVQARWAENRAAALSSIATATTYLSRALTIPTPETRWDKAARLEAEAKARAAAESE